ncbi:MAG: O-antigen ligase family protein [Candidatus Omnitrophica bacterium]|nr:O-antigen ligase family protein [Candidatus Omnitrophota bacterium]
MRALTLPWTGSRILGILALGLVATAMAGSVLWATRALEGKWIIAMVAGLSVFWLAVASGRFERFLLVLMLFIIPFNPDVYWHPIEAARGTPMLGISAMDLVLCCLYAAWITRLLATRGSLERLWPAGAGVLLGLIGWGALSMINAEEPLLSVFLLVGLVKAFLLFFYLANHVKTREDLWLAVCCLIAGLVAESLLAFAQSAAGSNLGLAALGEKTEMKEIAMEGSKFFRVGGTLGHPNFLGGYLATVLPLALALALVGGRKAVRLAAAGAFVLGGMALVLTLSRSAWLSAGVACVALLGWVAARRGRRIGPGPALIVILAMGLVGSSFAPLIMARWTGDDRGAAASRLPKIHAASAIIADHPILGVGLNNYTTVKHLYDTRPVGGTRKGVSSIGGELPHNLFLLLGAEMGLMSLVLLTWFLWIVARRAWQAITAADDDLVRAILLGITVALFARLLVHDTVHTGHLSTNDFFWVYSALLVARRKPSNA